MRIVITDTNILINLCIAGGLPLLASIPGHEFALCEEVRQELTKPEQEAAVGDAIARGDLKQAQLTTVEELETFAQLRGIIGIGEAASLALAHHHGFAIASDEKRVFRREAERRVGANNILTTVDIYLLAIQHGAISVEAADEAREVLVRNRFRMPFVSFREVLPKD